MESGDFRSHPLMRKTIAWTAVFLSGLWVTNFLMYFERMGLTPDGVRAHYLGSEAEFTPPRTYGSMLETTHFHLPVIALVMLFMTHLVIFSGLPRATKRWLITLTFLSALGNEGAGWLVRFVHPAFAVLKIAAFLSLQALVGILLAILVVSLWRAPRERP